MQWFLKNIKSVTQSERITGLLVFYWLPMKLSLVNYWTNIHQKNRVILAEKWQYLTLTSAIIQRASFNRTMLLKMFKSVLKIIENLITYRQWTILVIWYAEKLYILWFDYQYCTQQFFCTRLHLATLIDFDCARKIKSKNDFWPFTWPQSVSRS